MKLWGNQFFRKNSRLFFFFGYRIYIDRSRRGKKERVLVFSFEKLENPSERSLRGAQGETRGGVQASKQFSLVKSSAVSLTFANKHGQVQVKQELALIIIAIGR